MRTLPLCVLVLVWTFAQGVEDTDKAWDASNSAEVEGAKHVMPPRSEEMHGAAKEAWAQEAWAQLHRHKLNALTTGRLVSHVHALVAARRLARLATAMKDERLVADLGEESNDERRSWCASAVSEDPEGEIHAEHTCKLAPVATPTGPLTPEESRAGEEWLINHFPEAKALGETDGGIVAKEEKLFASVGKREQARRKARQEARKARRAARRKARTLGNSSAKKQQQQPPYPDAARTKAFLDKKATAAPTVAQTKKAAADKKIKEDDAKRRAQKAEKKAVVASTNKQVMSLKAQVAKAEQKEREARAFKQGVVERAAKHQARDKTIKLDQTLVPIKALSPEMLKAELKKLRTKKKKNGDDLPREALSPLQTHGNNGRVDPLNPRRNFLVPSARTPRGFQYCQDRHTVSLKTPESPRIKAELCGDCEDGYALLPVSNLRFKMLGICNVIVNLPLWKRATNPERKKYNDRSCRFFFSYKGFRLKKDYVKGGSQWNNEKRSGPEIKKRAHAYHCTVTSKSSDSALGEYTDKQAEKKVLARKGSKVKGADVIGEGWSYDYSELKVAKFAGCFTNKESKPKLSCNKKTQMVDCDQLKVYLTGAKLEKMKKDPNYPIKILKTYKKDDDYIAHIVGRKSWWRPSTYSTSIHIIDQKGFQCDSSSSSFCRNKWAEQRANQLAIRFMGGKHASDPLHDTQARRDEMHASLGLGEFVKKRPSWLPSTVADKQSGKRLTVKWPPTKCARIASESALSLQ